VRAEARVVVVGGGIYGCSLLYHLVKRGWSDVVLLEKNELTAGSTWHAAGLCTNFGHHLSVMRMRNHSVRLYRDVLEAETDQPTGFKACGALRVTHCPDRMDEFRRVAAMGRWIDVDYRILTPQDLQEIYPLALTEGLIGAIWEPGDGFTDPTQTTNALAKGARAGGAEIRRRCPVVAIEQEPSGAWRVSTPDGGVTAEHVVNAAGTWAREVGAMVGLDLPIVPMLHQYLVTDRVADYAAMDRVLPLIRDPEESWYVRPERDGAIIGVYEKDGVPWSVDGVPADFGMELLPGDLDRMSDIVACAMARIPALAEAGIKEIVNGPITFTPDANALIGPAPALRNLWIMAGTSMGVMEGGGAGKFLADWIVDGEPSVDMTPFDPRRFGPFADRDYRLERAIESFGNQFAIHYPGEERPAGRPRKTTPIYDRLAAKGAFFGVRFGWERANFFSTDGSPPEQELSFRRSGVFDQVAREVRGVTEGVGVIDLSGFSKFRVSGPDAEAFLNGLSANRVPRHVGAVALCHCLTEAGGIVAEFTVTRTGDRSFYLCSAASQQLHDLDWLTRHRPAGAEADIEDVTERTAVLGLQGPNSRDALAALCDAALDDASFPWLGGREIEAAGIPLLAFRLSYVGELGYELHLPMAEQARLYDALMAAGGDHGMIDFGFFALDSMRLEKAFLGFGADLSVETTPFQARLDRFVKLEGRAFRGRQALLRERQAGPKQKLVCLRVAAADADAIGNEPVLDGDGRTVGILSSGGYGHRVGASIALAYVEPDCARPGRELGVLILGDVRGAVVADGPLFDPTSARMRAV